MSTEPADACPGDGERGSAVVEFIGTTVLLLIPLIYLVLTVGRLQAATFAVDGGAHEAARAVITAPTSDDTAARARVAVALALEDQGFDPGPALTGDAVQVVCSADPCLTPGGTVTATVRTVVPLPFVPEALRSWVPLEVPVEAQYRTTVDQYAESR
ncbi:TadE family protein [Xylanimonas cellulosilytica DSM 15894]|uniref:TadE family protein n=1 Tax=Xylanimonas cellulosilytica (strain DSM 15894 / JCM 12276 / CECT 5975 / KCTC 9989 / LMG 20990 / NBRC 107835 / XIL07) TaxID=446471 RepID=D1BYY4_XYLCX|nr:TadE family protein [Xylanimonas cellulosilytica]ACZ30059.1 TadE family protein [Xylanimonas cellulosilytica DSM 15894]